MTAEPIMQRCPGSGYITPHGLCQYCGIYVGKGQTVPEHDTEDILAMLDRGDFTA